MEIKAVLENGMCAGCGLCAGLSHDKNVFMSIDSEGFLRPKNIDLLSKGESTLYASLCPGVNGRHVGNTESLEISKDALWGGYNFVGTGFSSNEQTRFVGSSGGILTEVGRYLLESGKVNGVLAVSTDRNDKLRSEAKIITTSEDLINMAGSKYMPSAPLALLNDLISFPGKLAVIGKPCDIAGLKLACKENPELKSKIEYFLSFFCAGVPSEKGNESILSLLKVNRKDLADFWHRGKGWPGSTTAITKNGDIREMSYREAWGGVLSKKLQMRCKVCADGIGEAADIVAADAWECDDAGYPVFSEAKGRSLVISRTNKGKNLLKELIDNSRVVMEEIDPRRIDKMQPGQLRRRRALQARLLALKVTGRICPDYPKSEIARFSKNIAFIDKVQIFFGALMRVWKSREKNS